MMKPRPLPFISPAGTAKKRWSPARQRHAAAKSAKASGGRRRLHGDAFVLEQGLQLARLEHFADDVAAADEFALEVKLRDGWPVGIGLDPLTQLVVFEHVETLIDHAEIIEDLHDLTGEAAHRKLRRAFHEQHHLVSLDLVVDELIDGHSRLPCWAAGKTLLRQTPCARHM